MESELGTFFIQEKWFKQGTDKECQWETDVDLDLPCWMFLFLLGLLNSLCRVVGSLSIHWKHIHTTLYLNTSKILHLKFDWMVEICHLPSAHLSAPIFLIAVRLGFMANNRCFLPEQEFPLWKNQVAFIGGSGQAKLCCIGNEKQQPFYFV